uniref:Uncharacterized protein n=1 Tax=Chromera velia CCMP2878 TaxID=1169474 RepID=A0A0G4HW02_9ALVE|eukprot:Cvel_8963.t1-p1 / transcript=Cvel_8963.t1 / gene=Cvel_8963 / organism=Chromera_velia_CCMP2878 / gene_product=hypothetical protein / transcript_product=hypothetical protein / location=Cvel_scaffold505:48085-49036(+) / protein_length=250 / sequence_SO=supercontig / SO=protein_coding / is_pseudo=false
MLKEPHGNNLAQKKQWEGKLQPAVLESAKSGSTTALSVSSETERTPQDYTRAGLTVLGKRSITAIKEAMNLPYEGGPVFCTGTGEACRCPGPERHSASKRWIITKDQRVMVHFKEYGYSLPMSWTPSCFGCGLPIDVVREFERNGGRPIFAKTTDRYPIKKIGTGKWKGTHLIVYAPSLPFCIETVMSLLVKAEVDVVHWAVPLVREKGEEGGRMGWVPIPVARRRGHEGIGYVIVPESDLTAKFRAMMD